MTVKAVNNYVWIVRDKEESEKGGLLIPGAGREKPHTGLIESIGKMVKDPDIKSGKGKKAIFHKGVGRSILFEEKEYLVLVENEIIGIK